jgi:hypothetical protein
MTVAFGEPNNVFGLFRGNAMLVNLGQIPCVPPEIHVVDYTRTVTNAMGKLHNLPI